VEVARWCRRGRGGNVAVLRQKPSVLLPATLLLLDLAGCWGGGGGVPITARDEKTVVGTLDEASLLGLCSDIDRWSTTQYGSKDFSHYACEVNAAAALRTMVGLPPDLRVPCRARASACEASGGSGRVSPRCGRWTGSCSATIGQVEQCLTDLSYNMYLLFTTAPMCDGVCRDVDPLTVDASSCAIVRAACPGFVFTRPDFTDLLALPPCQ
jgi:hypothetical protein